MKGRWLLRVALMALLLAMPGYWLAGFYEDALRWGLGLLLGTPLGHRPDGQVDLAATNVLVLYVAACLVTDGTPWSRRLFAVLVGIPAMMVLEFATGIVALATGAAGTGTDASRWLLEWPQLVGAPVLWLWFLSPSLARRRASLGSSPATAPGRSDTRAALPAGRRTRGRRPPHSAVPAAPAALALVDKRRGS